MPVFLVDPCQGYHTPLRTQTLVPSDSSAGTDLTKALASGVFNAGVYTSRMSFVNAVTPAVPFIADFVDYMEYQSRTVSAAATAQTIAMELRNMAKTMAINSVSSGAGTATLTISGSTDNSNFLTLDSLAAAATNTKQYTETTVGATLALSPLSFRWVKVVAGSAGAGNTTTLDIAVK